MIIFEKLRLVKEMITQEMIICWTMIISKTNKMMAIDLSKQQGLDADPKAIKKINSTEI